MKLLRVRTQSPLWSNLIALSALTAFLVPLCLYAYIGIFTRYVADDYETAGALHKYGFWGSQSFWYQSWSGRYTYFVVANLVQLVGVKAVPALTAVCLFSWLLVLFWLLYQAVKLENIQHPGFFAAFSALAVLFLTLRSLSFIHQILFWMTGILTYVVYLIFFTAGTALLVYRLRKPYQLRPNWGEVILAGVFAFITVGISELTATLQLSITVLGTIFFWRLKPSPVRQTGLAVLAVSCLASGAGFILMASAPGNAVRAALYPPHPDLVSLIVRSNLNIVIYLARWVKHDTILAASAYFVPGLLAYYLVLVDPSAVHYVQSKWRYTRLLWYSFLFLYLVLLSQFVTAYYTLNAEPPDRALVVPQYFVTLTVGLWGFISGSLLKQKVHHKRVLAKPLLVIGTVLFVVLVCIGPIFASTQIYTMIAPARERAIEWDERDQIIRRSIAAGERQIVVWYIRDLTRLGDYSSDPQFLVNRAAADYYGVDTIIALDQRPEP